MLGFWLSEAILQATASSHSDTITECFVLCLFSIDIIFSARPRSFISSTATSFYFYKSRMILRANHKQRFSVIELKVVFY